MSTWVLKFTQVDKTSQPILLHVSRKSDALTLDLDLLGTDGDAAYKTKIRERSLKKLQADNYDGSESEWNQLVYHVLVSKTDSNVPRSVSDNLEVGCVISGKGAKKILSITLRTKVEDITHKLGSIDLNHTDETDDVDLFGWACQAIDQRDDLSAQLKADAIKNESAQASIKALEKQLEDLVAAKEEHENELLSKFALLLNEKKLHIRAQQQQIAQQDAPPVVSHPSASKKRKQPLGKTAQDEEQSEESDGFEAMDVDHPGEVEESEDEEAAERRQRTPSRTPSTSSEDEDLDQAAKAKGKRNAKEAEHRELSKTPPPRSLPFTKKNAKADGTEKTTRSTRQTRSEDAKEQEEKNDATASEDDDDEL